MTVVLSKEADKDLQDIFDYSFRVHGIDQAYNYVSSFDDIFQDLANHTEMGRDRSESREGLRSIVKDLHIVFYRIFD